MRIAIASGKGGTGKTTVAALLVFNRGRTVDWKLALVIDPPTGIIPLVGGYYAHLFSGWALKFAFAGLLVLAGFFMLRPVKDRPLTNKNRIGFRHRKFGKHEYVVNLWMVLPITAITGLVAEMVGISGGSFKIPLMVPVCGAPMRVAVGTSTAMIATTGFMGLVGHLAAGDFNAQPG